MAVTATPALPQTPKSYKVQILPADTSSLKTIATGGANGTKINAINVASTDTSDRVVQFGIYVGSTLFILGTKTIPLASGTTAGTPSVALLNLTDLPGLPVDSDGNPYLFLSDASSSLQIKSLTTVTTAKEIDVVASGADF
jgi:hypothetical protein